MISFKNKGRRYGRLVVLDLISSNPHIYKCLCDCGTIKNVKYLQLFTGDVKSCGCLQKETKTRDGLSSSLEYSSWNNMHQRVKRPKLKDFNTYKDVKICYRWHVSNPEGFYNFLKDMGPRLSKSLTIDRIDNEKGYEPGNCRWADKRVQVLNRRMTKWLTVNGEVKCLRDWTKQLKIDEKTFYSYMHYHKISYEETIIHYLNNPKGKYVFKGISN
jgi:hypothetical protein